MRRIGGLVITALLFLVSSAAAEGFRLTSSSLQESGTLPIRHVFNGLGCTGENLSPQLSWQGEPAGTKSFAITVFDPDAGTGKGWWHWLVVNIPAGIHSLPENSGNPQNGLMPPDALQAWNDFGSRGYGGACPPAGSPSHRYQFTVWALDVEGWPYTADLTSAMILVNLQRHMLEKDVLTVTYCR